MRTVTQTIEVTVCALCQLLQKSVHSSASDEPESREQRSAVAHHPGG